MRDARNQYFSNVLISNKTGKEFWSTLKSYGSSKESKSNSNPVVELNSLNEYFCGVSRDIKDNLIAQYKAERNNVDYDSFSFVQVDSDTIYKVLMDIS
jgi:hypothetical protein